MPCVSKVALELFIVRNENRWGLAITEFFRLGRETGRSVIFSSFLLLFYPEYCFKERLPLFSQVSLCANQVALRSWVSFFFFLSRFYVIFPLYGGLWNCGSLEIPGHSRMMSLKLIWLWQSMEIKTPSFICVFAIDTLNKMVGIITKFNPEEHRSIMNETRYSNAFHESILGIMKARLPSILQVKLCGACCLVCAVVCVVITVTTTVVHMNRLQTLRECIYNARGKSCTCFTGPTIHLMNQVSPTFSGCLGSAATVPCAMATIGNSDRHQTFPEKHEGWKPVDQHKRSVTWTRKVLQKCGHRWTDRA